MIKLPEIIDRADFERQYSLIFGVPPAAFVIMAGKYLNAHMQTCYDFYCGQQSVPLKAAPFTFVGWTWYDPELRFALDERLNGKHMAGSFFSPYHVVYPTREQDAVNLYAYTSTLNAVKKCKN